MANFAPAILEPFARKFIRWKTPQEAVAFPQMVVAQVMNDGNLEDIEDLRRQVGDDYLIQVLATAEIGQFSPPSWHFWHYRLGLADASRSVPPMPHRRVA